LIRIASAPSVLVGYGPRADVGRRQRPLASPPVRKLAKDRGIDLDGILPSGRHGEVTRQDLSGLSPTGAPPTPASLHRTSTAPAIAPAADNEDATSVRGVRRTTAQAMTVSATTIPQAGVWLEVDATRSVKLQGRLRAEAVVEKRPAPTLLHLLARATLLAVRDHPCVVGRWDESDPVGPRIVQPAAIGLGIAAATGRGLLVPVVPGAEALDFSDLVSAISEVVSRARAGTCAPAELTGAAITLTNIGVFRVDGGLPLLPPGQTAIVCFGQARDRPWVHDGRIRARKVMQLSMTFDHRVIDGEQAARFLADLGSLISDPARALAR
jgi:pyruvate dehydrogenase E2 component (dihydrolipoamide acetyltransferase)